MAWRWLLAFALGVVAAALTPVLPARWLIVFLGFGAMAVLAWSPARLVAIFMLGVCWFAFHAQTLIESQWPVERAGESVSLTGTLTTMPQWRGDSRQFIFTPDPSGQTAFPERILVSWFRPAEYLSAGQRWRLTLRLEPPHGRLNDRGFDYHRYLLAQRIGALGTVGDSPVLLDQGRLNGSIDRLRQYLGEVLSAETTRLEAGALMRALAIADRGAITPDLSERLRQTGTAHLLAISGLHVGMVAALAGLLAGWVLAPAILVFRGLDRRRLALAAALLAATGYALLAGLTLPTQRAVLMLAVAGGAFLLRRGIQPGHALLLALVGVLLLDPLAPLATGFWMSFAAVAVLIWAFSWRPGRMTGVRGWVWGLLKAQVIVGVGLLPLNIGLFEQVAWVALPANLLAIPLVGFWVLPTLLLSLGLIGLDLPAQWPLAACESGLMLLVQALDSLHSIESAHQTRASSGMVSMVMAMAGALWLVGPPAWPARWLGAVLILPLLWSTAIHSDHDSLELHVLDVGQGLAVLAGAGDEWLLYDTGPGDGQGGDAIGRLLPGWLAARGVERLDRLVVSHDHRSAVGGLGSVRPWVDADRVFSSVPGLGQPCREGSGWHSGSYRFEFLHPSPGLPYLEGNSSCVLRIVGPGGSVLLPGRIDALVEQRLVDTVQSLDATVLVLSDGGHQRAGSRAFLERVGPQLALSSSTRFDRYGRPHEIVLERLEQIGASWVSTAHCGALTIRLIPGEPVDVSSAVGRSPRFWLAGNDCP